MNTLDVLNLLSKPIYDIDGQCFVCAGQFIEDANKEFEKANLSYRFRIVGEWSDERIEAYIQTHPTGTRFAVAWQKEDDMWEYKVVESSTDIDSIRAWLNENAGWELVFAVPNSVHLLLIFKRSANSVEEHSIDEEPLYEWDDMEGKFVPIDD